MPDFSVDWVIDQNFQEVALWHPAVRRTIASNHREWRKKPFTSLPACIRFLKNIRQENYPLILDGQGSLKSAAFALCAEGPLAGFDGASIREKPAHLAYTQKHSVAKNLHAIERLRQLFAKSLGYPLPTSAPNFSIAREKLTKPSFDFLPPFLMFIPNAGWKTKLWPEVHWKELIALAKKEGYTVLMPQGTEEEKMRAERLCLGNSKAWVLPKLSLSEIGYLLTQAHGCVSLDTGLSHLAAALSVQSVTLYGATDPKLIGTQGDSQKHLSLKTPCAPCHKRSCRLQPIRNEFPPRCLVEISPKEVFRALFKQ